MADIQFLLGRAKRARRRRKALLHFVDALTLHLEAGYDLAYSWPETLSAVKPWLDDALEGLLRPDPNEGMAALLTRLARSYPELSHRLWFGVLRELYGQGAGLTDAIRAMGTSLRREGGRDLDSHCRQLPGRLNLLLLIFFLPPTLLLLFVPLLQSLLTAF